MNYVSKTFYYGSKLNRGYIITRQVLPYDRHVQVTDITIIIIYVMEVTNINPPCLCLIELGRIKGSPKFALFQNG